MLLLSFHCFCVCPVMNFIFIFARRMLKAIFPEAFVCTLMDTFSTTQCIMTNGLNCCLFHSLCLLNVSPKPYILNCAVLARTCFKRRAKGVITHHTHSPYYQEFNKNLKRNYWLNWRWHFIFKRSISNSHLRILFLEHYKILLILKWPTTSCF